MKRATIYGFLLVVCPIFLAVVFYEIYIRYDIYANFPAHAQKQTLWVQNQPLTTSEVDALLGRETRMIPNGLFKVNATLDFGGAVGETAVLDFSVRTNNLGLLSDLPVKIERDPADPEYRILVFGDSLTGTTTANYQWVDTVEALLNGRPELRQAIGGKRFRVINLGWVAAGFSHFWKAFDRVGRQLDGDLLIVNFVDDDYPRAPLGPRYADEDDMIANARLHLELFKDTGIPLMVMQMPIYSQIFPARTEYKLTQRLQSETGWLRVLDMRDHMPLSLGRDFAYDWYNTPYDFHMSDLGGEIYARSFAAVVAERVTGRKVDFMADRTAYFDPAICLPGPRRDPGACAKRPRETSGVRRILSDPAHIRRLRDTVIGKMMDAKIWTLQPWFMEAVFRQTHPYIPNLTRRLWGGFEKIAYGDGKDEFAWLNIYCTAGERDLSNPDCYSGFHFYVK